MRHSFAGEYDASRQYKRGDVVRMPSGRHHVFSHRGFIDTVAPLDMSCVGPAGVDGVDGRDSIVPGPAGRDSIVPGPQGEPGPQGVGKRGRKGDPGATYYSSTVRKVSENVSKMQIGFSESMARGDVVRVVGDNICSKAIASGTDANAMAIGLVSSVGEVQTSGAFVNEAWSLTPMSVYYLDPNVAGGITDIQPLSIGNYIIIIGFSVAPQTLVIAIHHSLYVGA